MHAALGITVFWAGDLFLDALAEPIVAWNRLLTPLAILAFMLWRCSAAFRVQAASSGRKNIFAVGLANCITLLRGILLCGLGAFVFSPEREGLLAWVPAILYASASAMDILDGSIARARGEDSPAGETLDLEVDALGTLVAGILGYHYGRLPAFYLPVSGAYYWFRFASWLRMRHGMPAYLLTPSRIRRSVGTIQMWALAFLLSPLPTPAVGLLFAIPLVLMVFASFLRDWMTVVGIRSWRWGRSSTPN